MAKVGAVVFVMNTVIECVGLNTLIKNGIVISMKRLYYHWLTNLFVMLGMMTVLVVVRRFVVVVVMWAIDGFRFVG